MNTMADTLNQLRKYGLTYNIGLENKIQKEAIRRHKTLYKIKDIEKDLNEIYTVIEALNTFNVNKSIYEIYKSNSKAKEFYDEYKSKKDVLMVEYFNKNILIYDLTKLRKNTNKYIDNELNYWGGEFSICIHKEFS
ncbi:hypothetical protein [Streptococcus agalactiae]|uniref:hypothetical protein n=1 Tax=Streptococcus agalactiae TaxID=1311 RepID=UPI001C98B038|nr:MULTISPECIES: hypothetical protein [Bacillota]MBY5051968.1 hypothetical protein [Streptococcus agalactiae]